MTQDIPIGVDHVSHGMYISKLDCPWNDTPFLIQGFLVQDKGDISTLQKYCKYIYVDPTRSEMAAALIQRFEKKNVASTFNPQKPPLSLDTQHEYDIVNSVEDEVQLFRGEHKNLAKNVHDTLAQIKNGEKFSVEALNGTVEPLVNSIIRNPNAAILLNQMEQKDSYTFNHSLACSISALAFGRQLGLPKEDLRSLAVGALLFDIGKIKLPNNLLAKTGKLSEEEFDLVKKHVELGLEILQDNMGLDDTTFLMMSTHHERFLGQGYPKGLKGNEIPLVGRIAGIVDCYDAITSQRPYAPALPPHEAIRELYQWRDVFFQKELIETFIQSIGSFPVGTLVELSSNEVGVIIAQNPKRRLRPKVMLILDNQKKRLGCFATRDLSLDELDNNGCPLEIKRGLEKGAYGINPKDFFL